MSRTYTAAFDRLWQDAYRRDYPVLREAARLRRARGTVPILDLFRAAVAAVAGCVAATFAPP
jgi:hypothetical protein